MNQGSQGSADLRLRIQRRTNGSEQMRVIRSDRMLLVQFQSPYKRLF